MLPDNSAQPRTLPVNRRIVRPANLLRAPTERDHRRTVMEIAPVTGGLAVLVPSGWLASRGLARGMSSMFGLKLTVSWSFLFSREDWPVRI